MNKLIYWVFSKTKIGGLVDGNKRIIGFTVWFLAYLIQGLGDAAVYFPDATFIGPLLDSLNYFSDSYGDILKTLGIGTALAGVAGASAKEKIDPPKVVMVNRYLPGTRPPQPPLDHA